MRNAKGVTRYTGSVFLTKYLSDSEGHSRRVECESFESMASRLGVKTRVIYRLSDRGAIDGAFYERGWGWAPSPVRFLKLGDKPTWIFGQGVRVPANSSSAGSGSIASSDRSHGASENRASVVERAVS